MSKSRTNQGYGGNHQGYGNRGNEGISGNNQNERGSETDNWTWLKEEIKSLQTKSTELKEEIKSLQTKTTELDKKWKIYLDTWRID